MTLEKPRFFETKKEFIVVVVILIVLLLARLALIYSEYSEFTTKPFYYTKADVLLSYTKNRDLRSYQVLKLKSDSGKIFYTTTYNPSDLNKKIVRVKMLPDSEIGFIDYLGSPYIKTKLKILSDQPPNKKGKFHDLIASQHKSSQMSSFYQAIFLATPLPKKLREKISKLGVSHLIALSGFHLTILWALVYGMLATLYKQIQKRKFPHRFVLLDIGAVTLAILWSYLWFVDYPPSLLRSYTMLLIAWTMLLLGIELISFELLSFVALLLVALFPDLIVSLGFWFSICGVFYIYLILYWSQKSDGLVSNRWTVAILLIPFGIFILMLPIVHSVFGITSHSQLLSPLLSLLFIPFYPISILLHFAGVGGLFDSGLEQLFDLDMGYQDHILPLWVLGGYLALSIGAIWSRISFGLTLGAAILYLIYLFI